MNGLPGEFKYHLVDPDKDFYTWQFISYAYLFAYQLIWYKHQAVPHPIYPPPKIFEQYRRNERQLWASHRWLLPVHWLLSELWRHDRQGLLCVLVTSPVFQHPMLRQDVHFAERNFSEICCITEVEKAAEMYSYSSKRVNIILIHTLDVRND